MLLEDEVMTVDMKGAWNSGMTPNVRVSGWNPQLNEER